MTNAVARFFCHRKPLSSSFWWPLRCRSAKEIACRFVSLQQGFHSASKLAVSFASLAQITIALFRRKAQSFREDGNIRVRSTIHFTNRAFPELNEFQPSRRPQPAKSEQSANPTTHRLNPESEWKALPERVCSPGLVCLSPRPSVQAVIASWPERHTPRRSRRLRSSSAPAQPTQLPAQTRLPDIPRALCKPQNNQFRCCRSPKSLL